MENKTLFFRNLFVSLEGKENNESFHQATFHLASAFKEKNLPFVICNSKFSTRDSEILTNIGELDELLDANRDINIVAITLIESCFDKVKKLSEYIQEKTSAYIAVGGLMPTSFPEHVLLHLPKANIIVRGEGEKVLPEIQKILSGTNVNSNLNKNEKQAIKDLKGVIFRNNKETIYSEDFSINQIKNLDDVFLDFSLIQKNHIAKGLSIITSKGCNNNCIFCTIPERGKFRGRSIKNLKEILNNYKKRLVEIFKKEELIPDYALKLSFYDDDFLADRDRAIEFFKFMKNTNFKIDFIQTSINSFFKKINGEEELDYELIRLMEPSMFYSSAIKNKKDYAVYIGTENFCDDELKRLGKGYTFEKIEKVVEALDKQSIRQAHHLILTNINTTLDNILENFIKIAVLKTEYSNFDILLPVIPNLVSFYQSASYKKIKNNNQLNNLLITQWLKSKEKPDLDYPLVEKDIPVDEDVREIADKINSCLKGDNYHEAIFEKILLSLLNKSEYLKIKNKEEERIKKIDKVLEDYHNYPKLIKQKLPEGKKDLIFKNNKNNFQIMLTRRCQLRCKYCPVPKKDADMEYRTLKVAIDMLFKSNYENLRVDFTGGEPLLRFDLLKKAIDYSINLAKIKNKQLSFYIVTNAINLKKEVTDFLDGKNLLLELSIDGNEATHNRFKIPLENINPYELTTSNIKNTLDKDIDKFVVLVTTPQTVDKLFENFCHIISLGFNKIDINYSIGDYWDYDSLKSFFQGIDKIINKFKTQLKNKEIELGNLEKRGEPAVLNSEFMVDTEGSIKLLNEFLFKSENIGESPYHFGSVFTGNLNELYVNKFMVYYSLVKMFAEENKDIRRILRNNINLGLLSQKFFSKVKMDLKND